MSSENFIIICLSIMIVIAVLLSIKTMIFLLGDEIYTLTRWEHFGYIIFAIISTPFLWVVGVGLIIEYIFRQMREQENKHQ